MAMRKDSEARAADIDTPTIGPLHTMTLNWVPQGEAAGGNESVKATAPIHTAAQHPPRYAPLAATIAIVAALGALAGLAVNAGLSRDTLVAAAGTAIQTISTQDSANHVPANQSLANQVLATQISVTQALQDNVAQLTAELAALKAAQRNANEITGSIARRLDRSEKALAEPAAKLAKLAESVDRLDRRQTPASARATSEVTGSVNPAISAKQATKPQIADGWWFRDYYGGRALVEDRNGTLFEAAPGTNLPGLGRVELIKREDGRVLVVTRNGVIASTPVPRHQNY